MDSQNTFVAAGDRLPERHDGVFRFYLSRGDFDVRQIHLIVREFSRTPTECRLCRVVLEPSEAELIAAAGTARYRHRGYKKREYAWGCDRDGIPIIVELWRPWLEVWDAAKNNWSKHRVICQPTGVDEKLKIGNDAIAWIKGAYGIVSLSWIEQKTGVRYRKLRAIGVRIALEDEIALLTSDFAAEFLAIDKIFMADHIGGRGGYITVVAVRRGLRPIFLGRVALWEERIHEDANGRKRKHRVEKAEERIIDELAAVYARLPSIAHLQGIAMDGEKWLKSIDLAARKRASETHPGFDQVEQVGDRWHFAHNVKKPLQAVIIKLRKTLPKGEDGAVERWMLGRFKYYFVDACWYTLAENEAALWVVTAILEHFSELEEPFWVVKLFIDLQAAPDAATAKQRFDAWQASLTDDMRKAFKKALDYIDGGWEAFLTYFEIKERTGLSVTSSPVESQHSCDKRFWIYARSSSAKLLDEKSRSRRGAKAQFRQADLAARRVRQRAPRKKPEAANNDAPAEFAAAA